MLGERDCLQRREAKSESRRSQRQRYHTPQRWWSQINHKKIYSLSSRRFAARLNVQWRGQSRGGQSREDSLERDQDGAIFFDFNPQYFLVI